MWAPVPSINSWAPICLFSSTSILMGFCSHAAVVLDVDTLRDSLFQSSKVKSTPVRVDAKVELDKDVVLQRIRQSGTLIRIEPIIDLDKHVTLVLANFNTSGALCIEDITRSSSRRL